MGTPAMANTPTAAKAHRDHERHDTVQKAGGMADAIRDHPDGDFPAGVGFS